MRVEIFEQVNSKNSEKLFDEKHIMSIENMTAPNLYDTIWLNDPGDRKLHRVHIEFKVIRKSFSVMVLSNKYNCDVHCEILVREMK